MELMQWLCVAAAAAVVGIGWFFLIPIYRGWKSLDERMTDQVTQSAALVKECSAPMGCGTAFGRLSTIR
jgi:hypothetical protein